MKHLIIGCGISGIHIAIQLLDKGITGEDILILERYDYNCSKIYTIKEDVIREDGKREELLLEMGPSVFHSNQKELIKLITRLNLLDTFEKVDPKSKAYYIYKGLTPDEAKKEWRELKKKVFKVEDMDLTLKEASRKVLNNKEYDLLKWCWGEWDEICDNNLQILKKSLKEEGEYIIMKGGLDQIIVEGIKYLEERGVNIKYEHEVKKIEEGLTIYDNKGNIYNPEKLYICANLKGAKKIKTDIPLIKEYLSLGKSKNTMRFYVNFKIDLNIPYKFIFGKYIGKYSIKYSDTLWLIAYPDGEYATKLNNMAKRDILKDWINMMNQQFDLNLKLKDVNLEHCAYWQDAFSILTKRGVIEADKVYNKLKDQNIIITSLPKDDGEESGWMEGNLYEL